ncbi:MAG: hypothetical protein FWE42_00185, partial [Defluviitaleaceae bacterium]|nr:hypothetical protein [Defluviitaleaceae bacterium]
MDTLKKRNERPKGKCLRKLNIIIGTMIALFIMTGIFFAYRLLSGDEIMYEHYVYSENEINDITYPAADSETAEDYVRPENT